MSQSKITSLWETLKRDVCHYTSIKLENKANHSLCEAHMSSVKLLKISYILFL